MRIPNRALIQIPFVVVDVSTCEPVKENFVEIWATNATGVYAGVSSNGNGDGNVANLVSLISLEMVHEHQCLCIHQNTTHGRGVQKTSDDGAVQFETIFPGQ